MIKEYAWELLNETEKGKTYIVQPFENEHIVKIELNNKKGGLYNIPIYKLDENHYTTINVAGKIFKSLEETISHIEKKYFEEV